MVQALVAINRERQAMNKYDYPVYATEGGGLARYQNGLLVWLEPPMAFPEMQVGGLVPEIWGWAPANKAAVEYEARKEME